jgi:hypothetical protein
MENREIVKQMVDLYKTSFENSFSTMVMLQDHAEKLLKDFIDHNPGMSDEGKKVIDQWNNVYKKGLDDFKKIIEEGFAKVESFFSYNNALGTFQDQTKEMFKYLIPQDFQKTMDEMTAMYKKGYEDFKKYVDDNIKSAEVFSPAAGKTQTRAKLQK